jgi:muconolactone delta-isomerase
MCKTFDSGMAGDGVSGHYPVKAWMTTQITLLGEHPGDPAITSR